jgi:tripartite-type tricarboxylate transporter receptor subunit TctC
MPDLPNRQAIPATLRDGPRRTRRCALLALAAAAASVLLPAVAAAAETWPSRPIRIIVPFPPGGPADGSARVLAEAMGPEFGSRIVVDNRTGGGGIIGVTAAAQANDGHTLLMGSTSMTVTPALRSDLPYDILHDFHPIGMVSAQPLVLVVPADSKLASVADVIEAGRAQKGSLTAGNSGVGTLSHLATELFNIRTGAEITPVPYRGENALMPDLLTGTVSLGFLNLPILLPQLQSGKLRALAVSAKAEVPELPGARTFKELGIEDMEVEGWAALLAGPGIPPEALDRLSESLRRALASPGVRQRLEAFGTTPVSSTREELGAFLRSQMARWGEVVRTRNIKAE